MKKKLALLLSVTCVLLFSTTSNAQQPALSPLPQNVVWDNVTAFTNNSTYYLTGESTADVDAVSTLKSALTVSAGGTVQIIIGERGDASVAHVVAEIPTVTEGYFLKIETNKVTIAGNDSVGTFYGVQTFLQLAAMANVQAVTIKDFPSVVERGVVEGYYGNPFSQEDRIRQFNFYGKNKMNVYLYGPKDDPYHNGSWRDNYPTAEAEKMKALVAAAHKNKVKFVWAMHPGGNINWNLTDSQNIVRKLNAMYDLGVRNFAMFFDDISGEGTRADKQAGLLNYLTNVFVKTKSGVGNLILCPTQYNKGWSSGDYLDVLGTQMDASVRVMWTGNSVVSTIDKATMDWINARIKRNAYIWFNYPCTDYVVDHMLMGPTYGNGLNIANQLSGFSANPSEYAEASKISLYSIADYCWNMPAYNSQQSWLNGIQYLMPNNYNAFKIFCENSVDLGPTYHGLRRANESAIFKPVADSFMYYFNAKQYKEAKTNELLQQFQSFIDASLALQNDTYNPYLITEIKPWLQVFAHMGSRGVNLVNMYKAIQNNDTLNFIKLYKTNDSLEVVQNAIQSRNFAGSIKAPFPKPANEVVAPFLKLLKASLISAYKSKFSYMKNIFPVVLLEDGKYYIKLNGKYLTNNNPNGSGGAPSFSSIKDTINPQKQEWLLSVEPSTDRYKLLSAIDSRYVNENGNFGTNAYYSDWNTYVLYRMNNKYALQNAGSAGTKFWGTDNVRLSPSAIDKYNTKNFIVEIVPVGQDSTTYPKVDTSAKYFIKNGNYYLTSISSTYAGVTPLFRALYKPYNLVQQFKVSIDTFRYKIENVASSMYLSNNCTFENANYNKNNHTFRITEMNNKYSIQISDNAGNDYLGVSSGKLAKSAIAKNDSYNFELISLADMMLPTNLISFTVSAKNSEAIISFETATETNVVKYIVEYSYNNIDWQPIKELVAGKNNYSFNYASLINGENYFRLVELANNGAATVLSTKSLTYKNNTTLKIYPNPAKANLFVNSKQKGTACLYAINGEKVAEYAIKQGTQKINLPNAAAGNYWLRFNQEVYSVIKN